jgi:hypothetical protein
VTTSGEIITFKIVLKPNSSPNTYVSSINLNNTTNIQGNTSGVAALTLAPRRSGRWSSMFDFGDFESPCDDAPMLALCNTG